METTGLKFIPNLAHDDNYEHDFYLLPVEFNGCFNTDHCFT